MKLKDILFLAGIIFWTFLFICGLIFVGYELVDMWSNK